MNCTENYDPNLHTPVCLAEIPYSDIREMLEQTKNGFGYQKESISKIYGTISLRYGDYESECSTTEDGQNGNPIDFANDFIKLDSHLTIWANLVLVVWFSLLSFV